MKFKSILATVSVAFLAVSCSNEGVVAEQEAQNSIEFSVSAGKTSRSADYYCNNHLPSEFTVWAAVEVGDNQFDSYYENESYSKNGLTNEYKITSGITRYWPDGKKMAFWAAKNYDKFNWNVGEPSTIEFAPKAVANDQLDLIYGYTTAKRDSKGTSSNFNKGKAGLNFRHALSQIVFYAKNENKNIWVEVESIALNNAAKSGVYTLPSGDNVTNENLVGHQQNQPVKTTGLGSWNLTFDEENINRYTVDVKTADGSLVALNGSAEHATNLTDNGVDSNVDQTATAPRSFLVLPENTTNKWDPKTVTSVSATCGTYFTVKCKIRNISGTDGVVKDSDIYLWGSKDEAKELAIPVDFKWEQGKKYIYTIKFTAKGHAGFDPGDGSDVLIPIEFSVKVDDFGSVTDNSVDL